MQANEPHKMVHKKKKETVYNTNIDLIKICSSFSKQFYDAANM